MKTVSFLACLAVPIFACAQSASDSRTAVLANTHGRVHDLIADMFSRDSDTLEQWKSDPNHIPHTDEMCTAGEQAGLKMLVANVRALNSSPSDPSALSGTLQAALRLETYQPATRDQLKKTLTAAISAANSPSEAEVLKSLDQPTPDQVEVSREDLACHFIPSQNAPEVTTAAGPTFEVVIGKDGKTKSAKPFKIQGEVPTWQMARAESAIVRFTFSASRSRPKGL